MFRLDCNRMENILDLKSSGDKDLDPNLNKTAFSNVIMGKGFLFSSGQFEFYFTYYNLYVLRKF